MRRGGLLLCTGASFLSSSLAAAGGDEPPPPPPPPPPPHAVCVGLEGARAAECGALAAFGEEHEYGTWTKHGGWLQSADYCAWEGVECHADDRRVKQLVLINVGVPGDLSRLGGLAALGRMQDLVLMMNRLTGTIPDVWARFPALHYLGLDQNRLTGTIPASVGRMTSLKELIVWGNALSGTLPASLRACTDLETLSASANALRGAGLTGTIPDLSPLTKLSALYLQENLLEGAPPASLGALTGMKRLWLNDNRLTGAVPDLAALTDLDMLHLEKNALRAVPAAFCAAVPRECALHGNAFACGELPQCVRQSACAAMGKITCTGGGADGGGADGGGADGGGGGAPDKAYDLQDPDADHRLAAIARDEAGDEAAAVESFRAAAHFAPRSARHRHNLAIALLGVEGGLHRDEAIGHLRKAIELDADDAESRDVLAEVLAAEKEEL